MRSLLLALLLAVVSFGAEAVNDHKVKLDIPGLNQCPVCDIQVTNALNLIKGVKFVANDIVRHESIVIFDADETSTDQLIESLGKIGYKNIKIKSIETY